MIRFSLLIVLLGSARLPAAEFLELGQAFVYAISADGTTAVGQYTYDERVHDQAGFRWSIDQGLQPLASLPGEDNRYPSALNADGSVAVGISYDFDQAISTSAVTWNAQEVIRSLGFPRGTYPLALSANASVIVGNTPNSNDGLKNAFRWTVDHDMEVLGTLPGFDESRANGVSADGNVVVGEVFTGDLGVSNRKAEPFFWTEETGMVSLGLLPNAKSGYARAVSSDGRVVVGEQGYPGPAFRWTADGGMVDMGQLPRKLGVVAMDLNAEGSIVVGSAGETGSDDEIAAVWDQEHGLRDLRQVLQGEHGLDGLPILSRASGISDDGRTIVGYNLHGDDHAGWIVMLDRPLVATSGVVGDFNSNSQLDVEDVDLLAAELQHGRQMDLFDVNDDSIVDFADRRHWVHELARTYFGDTNLDSEFNSQDLVSIFVSGEYEDDLASNSTWATGDWNGDGDFTSSDLVLAFEDGGYEHGPRVAARAVPEPSAPVVLWMGLIMFVTCVRRGIARL
jgi:uncharacterized membrane protein